jgi:hypothetical protein
MTQFIARRKNQTAGGALLLTSLLHSRRNKADFSKPPVGRVENSHDGPGLKRLQKIIEKIKHPGLVTKRA